MKKPVVYTIGHSTRKLEDLIEVLKHYGIKSLIDIRHFPRSRHNPQFNMEKLAVVLPKNNIMYFWIEKLGGFRKGGYKNYTYSKEFSEGLGKLESLASKNLSAIMCAELLWFKCHRRFVSDFLKRRGWKVVHIKNKGNEEPHFISKKRKKIRCG